MPLGGPVCVPMWMCACMCVKGYKDLCLGRPEFKPISLLLALWERGSPPLCLSLLFCELGMVMFAFTCVRINTQHRTHQVTLWLQLTWILLGTPKGAQGTPGKSQEQTSNKLKQSSKPKQVLRGHSSIGQHLTSGTHSTAILKPHSDWQGNSGKSNVISNEGSVRPHTASQSWFSVLTREVLPLWFRLPQLCAGGSRCFSGACPKIQSLTCLMLLHFSKSIKQLC